MSTITTASGLQYEELTEGSGAEAIAGKTVTVTYTGYLYNVNAANFEGTEFDSSSLHTATTASTA